MDESGVSERRYCPPGTPERVSGRGTRPVGPRPARALSSNVGEVFPDRWRVAHSRLPPGMLRGRGAGSATGGGTQARADGTAANRRRASDLSGPASQVPGSLVRFCYYLLFLYQGSKLER
jgi:hypothetical protein